jgi:molybdopterin-containing oxidoreductase family iron-sulfur binding subunit
VRYGLVIDLRKCTGCYSCMVACKAENFTPPGVFFTRVLVEERGKYPNARWQFVPLQCNHCSSPACVTVCPTGATMHCRMPLQGPVLRRQAGHVL